VFNHGNATLTVGISGYRNQPWAKNTPVSCRSNFIEKSICESDLIFTKVYLHPVRDCIRCLLPCRNLNCFVVQDGIATDFEVKNQTYSTLVYQLFYGIDSESPDHGIKLIADDYYHPVGATTLFQVRPETMNPPPSFF